MRKLLVCLLIIGLVGWAWSAGNIQIKYDTPLCDSLMLIHEDAGTIDTAIYTNVYGIDSTIATSTLTTGFHTFIVRFLYDGETDWLSAYDFVNTGSSGALGGDKILRVYAVDTSGTDAAVPAADISIFYSGGADYSRAPTGGAGYMDFTLPSDVYLIAASKSGYFFSRKNTTVTVSKADTICGYDIPFPAASASIADVTAYMDLSTGGVSGGVLIPYYRNIKGKLRLVGESFLRTTTGQAIIPRDYVAEPDAAGRITFSVPANSVILPAGSYYELYFTGTGSSSIASVPYMKFTLDTIPDPINILKATRVR